MNYCQMPSHSRLKINTAFFTPWIICFIGGLVFFFEYFQINMFNVLDKYLLQEFNMNASTLGLLSSVYFYGTILLLFPAGIIIDCFSIRKVIAVSMIVAIIGTIMFSLGTSKEYLIISRLIVGLGIGPFALISAIKLISRWMIKKEIFLAISTVISMGMLAGILSQAPFAFLINKIGWRQGVLLDAMIGLLILILTIFFVKDEPLINKLTNENNIKTSNYKLFFIIKNVIKRKTNWYIGIFTSFLNMPLFLLGSMVGGLYLEHIYHYNIIEGSTITAMLYWGMLIGCPIFGYIAGISKHKLKIMLLGAFIYLIAISLLIWLNALSKIQLYLIFFFIGFGVSAQNISFSLIENFNSKDEVGIAEALHSIFIMFGGAVFQPLLGLILDLNWEGKIENGIRMFSSVAYNKAFLLMPTTIILATFLLATTTKLKEVN